VQSSPPVRIDDDVTWRRVSRRASQSQTCRQLTHDGRVEAKRSERTRSSDAMRDAVASRVRKTRERISAKRLLPIARAEGYALWVPQNQDDEGGGVLHGQFPSNCSGVVEGRDREQRLTPLGMSLWICYRLT
jgi:hypothetical protein